ncbi:MAG: hypothetical protein ACOZQL_41420 [Myxococcota bacterium]
MEERELSGPEKQAWASLSVSVLVWAFLAMRLTDGGRLADVGARHLVWTYVATVVLMTVAHGVIAALLARRDGDQLKDERDAAIEARADRLEGYVVVGAINVVVIHALADAAFVGHALPRIDLSSLPTLTFVLLTTLFVGHLVKQAAIIWQYRA